MCLNLRKNDNYQNLILKLFYSGGMKESITVVNYKSRSKLNITILLR